MRRFLFFLVMATATLLIVIAYPRVAYRPVGLREYFGEPPVGEPKYALRMELWHRWLPGKRETLRNISKSRFEQLKCVSSEGILFGGPPINLLQLREDCPNCSKGLLCNE